MLRRLGTRPQGDRGLALPFALWVILIVTGLIAALVTVVLFATRQTNLGRDRSQATGASEAGVDEVLAAVEVVTEPANLPCWMEGGGTGSTAPKYQAEIFYFDAGGTPVGACTGYGGAALLGTTATAPVRALVTSEGWSDQPANAAAPDAGKRTFQALLTLNSGTVANPTTSPTPGGGAFDKAIFGDAFISLGQSSHINGYIGNDANIYSNGTMTCGNSAGVQGSSSNDGSVEISNTCTLNGDLLATGDIWITGNLTVNGNVSSATGRVGIATNARINGSVYAKQWICVANSGTHAKQNKNCLVPVPTGTVTGSVNPNASSPPAPVKETFPTVTFEASEWTTQGWTVESVPCANVSARMKSVTTKTVIVATGCPAPESPPPNNPKPFGVELDGEYKLKTDVAVISENGFYGKQSKFRADGSQKLLYLIVPANGTRTTTCNTDRTAYEDVFFKTSNEVDSPVASFIYTPCAVQFGQSPHYEGQIYGGAFIGGQSFEMEFIPVALPGTGGGGGGGGGGGETSDGQAYTVDILYKREIPNQ